MGRHYPVPAYNRLPRLPGTPPLNLSVILITRNEANHVAACLQSVAFADEWIVVEQGVKFVQACAQALQGCANEGFHGAARRVRARGMRRGSRCAV